MFEIFVQKNKLASYRLDQLNNLYYKNCELDPARYTVLNKDLREHLKAEVGLMPLEVLTEIESDKKDTKKVVFRTYSGAVIETVLMKHHDRNTICISCMSGCPVGCKFCATGKMDFGGHLNADEIVAQVIYFANQLKQIGQHVDNIVYMGMGEPMLNFEEVWKSYEILTDPKKFGLGKRKATISTSGFVGGIRKLIDRGYRGRLAISLHAPTQELREELMPKVAKSNKLASLLEVLDEFEHLTNKRITYEYILIDGVTDKPDQAKLLGKMFGNRLAHFNLIPYNPVLGESFRRSPDSNIRHFEQIMKDVGVPVSVRRTMGDDIKAACGQLAGKV